MFKVVKRDGEVAEFNLDKITRSHSEGIRRYGNAV